MQPHRQRNTLHSRQGRRGPAAVICWESIPVSPNHSLSDAAPAAHGIGSHQSRHRQRTSSGESTLRLHGSGRDDSLGWRAAAPLPVTFRSIDPRSGSGNRGRSSCRNVQLLRRKSSLADIRSKARNGRSVCAQGTYRGRASSRRLSAKA
jgi:hypothetical protein